MFSDDEWLSLLRLSNCILKETSRILQLLFAFTADTLRVFMFFVGKRDFRCREKLNLID